MLPRPHLRPRVLAAIAIVLCAAIAGGVYFLYRTRAAPGPAEMIAALPQTGATLAYLDMDALRAAGFLDVIAGSKAVREDPEYRSFVDATGFDYRRDLQGVAAAFSSSSAFFVVHGRFDWPRLREYANRHGGTCKDSICRVPGSTPSRWVSFWPMQSGVMALASSPNDRAAGDIGPLRRRPSEVETPERPIWISVPPASISESSVLPAGARSFTSPLASAERVVFSVGQENGALKLFLDVTSPTDAGAADLIAKLQGATDMLNKMLAREKVAPNEADLSGLLSAGSFRRDGRRVRGEWPLHKKLIESLAGGSLS